LGGWGRDPLFQIRETIMEYTTADLSGAGEYTDWISPKKNKAYGTLTGFLDFMISGTWEGTLTVQKRHTHNSTPTDPVDLVQYTTNKANLIEDHSASVEYRIGFKIGDYTSGTATVRLEQ
jgi:hypothetical protein